MTLSFEKPVGAVCDVKELEYITALLRSRQDEKEQYRYGSIQDTDVKNFLLSRYGIQVSKEDVQKYIFHDLAGSGNTDVSFDIAQIVSILLIPYLCKVITADAEIDDDNEVQRSMVSRFEKFAYERKKSILEKHENFNRNIIQAVLKIIMKEATGSDELIPLNTELMRKIFIAYNEEVLSEDEELLNAMVAAATDEKDESNTGLFDAKAFARGLTYDLSLYNQYLETKFTTHYEDVFGLVNVDQKTTKAKVRTKEEEQNEEEQNEEDDENVEDDDAEDEAVEIEKNPLLNNSHVPGDVGDHSNFKRVNTFSQIDNLSDTFRDKMQYTWVWLTVIFGFIAYFDPFNTFGIKVCKPEDMTHLGCRVLDSIIIWFAILSTMIIFMVPSVLLLSLGNDIHRHSLIEVFIGFLAIGLIVFFPAFYTKIDNRFISTANQEDTFFSSSIRVLNLTLGAMLCFFQTCNVVRCIVPDNTLAQSKLLTLILRGSGVRSEFGIKQAAVKKIHNLVQHAFELSLTSHSNSVDGSLASESAEIVTFTSDQSSNNSPSSISLLNFLKKSKRFEKSGGFIWAWKAFLTDSLVENHGIWIHTRLLAATLSQLIITFLITAAIYMVTFEITDTFYQPVQVPQNSRCGSIVDPSMCIFPEDGNGSSMGFGLCNNVILTNATCLGEFVSVPDEYQDYFCNAIKEAAFMNQFNQYLDFENVLQTLNEDPSECPHLYMPYPSEILTAFVDSQEDSFCVSPLTACTPTAINSYLDEVRVNCIIGQRESPFQFSGKKCSSYMLSNKGFHLLGKTMDNEDHAFTSFQPYAPSKSTIKDSIRIGLAFAFVAGLSNFIISIPNQIITTMKFRAGVLEHGLFLHQRHGMLNLTYLLGAFFWGTFTTCLTVFALFSILSFLIMYQVTCNYLIGLIAGLIGAVTTVIVKALVSRFLNIYSFVGFYRKRPLFANVANVTFECWHLAVSSSFLIFRALRILVVVAWNIGRVDIRLLAKGVGDIGPYEVDSMRDVFTQDLLAIDSHRHPYIERLGYMFLLKLRHGKEFASRTGSHWRLLFVFALMPYLRKNRIDAVESSDNESDDDLSENSNNEES